MNKLQIIFAAALFTASGSLQAASPSPTIAANDLSFVNRIFQDLDGRAPSATELAADLDALQQGTSTRAQLAASLFDSAEFHDNAGFLVKCYSGLLQHDSDFTQWAQILKVMQSGASQDSALAAFMSTPEFAAAFPDSLSDGAFVTNLHRKLLARDPDAREFDSYSLKLAQGASRPTMIEEFLRGAEFEARIASRVNANLAYLAFLRHAGEATAIEGWTGKLDSGATVTDLIGDLISTPEYAARF